MARPDRTLIENEAARVWAADNRDKPDNFASQTSATRSVYLLYVQQKLGGPLTGTAA
jgi:hypothetical protein